MTVNMLKSKIHRATVKQAELQYVGSITIDEALMEAAGIFEYEKVQSVDMFCWTGAVETVMSLVQQKPDDSFKVGIDADMRDGTKTENKSTECEMYGRCRKTGVCRR